MNMNPSSTLNYLKKPFKKFSNLKLSKKSKISDELHDVSLERADSFEDLTLQHSSLPGVLNGDLETAVSQYFNQSQELDYYKDSRDKGCSFTTFKTPALPKKTLKPVSQTESQPISAQGGNRDNQHLDVKFEALKISPAVEAEDSALGRDADESADFEALDNPLYLSLDECSSGSRSNSSEHLYENANVPISDEDEEDDHIYENVEPSFHLYDTVSNPPRPKLPPKPGQNQTRVGHNQFESEPTRKRKSKSAPAPPIPSREDKPSKSKTYSILALRREEKAEVRDGSETSDLGSSGSEDTISEEDWPLPPAPSQIDVASTDIPFPPPPLELALQQLEDNVLGCDGQEKETAELNHGTVGTLSQENYDFVIPQLESHKNIPDYIDCVEPEVSLPPKEVYQSQKEVSQTPKEVSQSQEEVSSLLKEVFQSQKVACQSLEESSHSLKEVSQSVKEVPHSQKEVPHSKKEVSPSITDDYQPSLTNCDTREKRPLTREESLKNKHFKNRASTINKGLIAYKEASLVLTQSEEEQPNLLETPSLKIPSNVEDQFEGATSIRHSVVIELKDSMSPPYQPTVTPTQKKKEVSMTEPSEEAPVNSSNGGGVCLQIKQDCFQDEKEDLNQFSDQIIEISDDGSWEMKETVDDSSLLANESTLVDPFTGQPILIGLTPNVLAGTLSQFQPALRDNIQPETYFESSNSGFEREVVFEDKDDVYSASCVTTFSGASSLSSILTESLVEVAAEARQPLTIKETPTEKLDHLANYTSNNNIIRQDALLDVAEEAKSTVAPDECPSKISPKGEVTPQPHSVNIGAAIMAGYEKDLQRKKENLNLPEISLLEFGDSVKDLEIQRRDVIQQMTVKAKRKDSWIRSFRPSNPSDKGSTTSDRGSKNPRDEERDLNEKLSENQKPNLEIKNTFVKLIEDDVIPISRPIDKRDPENPLEPRVIDPVNRSQVFSSNSSPIEHNNNTLTFVAPDYYASLTAETHRVNEAQRNNYSSEADAFMKLKNKANNARNKPEEFLGKCLKNKETKELSSQKKKGEVDERSILEKKEETRSYWESKMLAAVDDGGWEPVANVRFQSEPLPNGDDTSGGSVPPPPEFSADVDAPEGSLSSTEDSLEDFTLNEKVVSRPTSQYMYGADQDILAKIETCHIETRSKKPSSQENVIEAEIREQQLREEALRRESDIRARDKSGGASSPSSHTSDEGFVDRSPEEIPSPPSPSSSHGGYTHTLRGSNGEPVIYDAVSPPSQFFTEKNSANEGDSETKIALEIRDLKEREAELRAMREMREKEQEARHMRRADVEAELVEFAEEDCSSKDLLEEHLISLTTTTDEGNFSEYGETNSSEDKSSDGSNSRIMSPDFQSYGSHADLRQRKPVSVKPFEDEDPEEQPVYTRMKKESVIEREIRLAREREEAYRREKGLCAVASPIAPRKLNSVDTTSSAILTNGHSQSAEQTLLRDSPASKESAVEQPIKRGVQHRIATNRIQQEIEETSQRERELRSGGQIRTLSEETVDSKVTRLADFTTEQNNIIREKASRQSSTLTPSAAFTSPAPASNGLNYTLPNNKRAPSPLNKRAPSPIGSTGVLSAQQLYSGSQLSASSNRLTRSLSTNNLSLGGGGSGSSNGVRAPQKGLMEKFFASRGKLTGTTFVPHISSTATLPSAAKLSSTPQTTTTTANGVPTRPMKVMPKAAVIRRDPHAAEETEKVPKVYRRTHATAEEKIQEELREMKQREEELRRLRTRSLGRSHPNLAGLGETDEDEDFSNQNPTPEDGVDSSPLLHEVNGELRSAVSNPNLLDDNEHSSSSSQPQAPAVEKSIRRRSALIAQWEGMIQQTTET